VLIVIARARTLRLAELAKVEALNSTMLSRIIKKLEASGLVTRECDTRDARIIHLAITPAGISMRNTIQKEQSAALLLALQKLSGEERLLLTAAAPVLLDVINKLRESNQ
jgi:DNA-binding MarR family transcriptional regulator